MQFLPTNETYDSQSHSLRTQIEIPQLLKKFTLNGRDVQKVELFFDHHQGLIAKITSCHKESLILGDDIKGIPNEVKCHPEALRQFVSNAYVLIRPIQEKEKQLFAIYVNAQLKGGGPGQSKTKQTQLEKIEKIYQQAQEYTKNKFYDDAIQEYTQLIPLIEKTKTDNQCTGTELNRLVELSRDTCFNLGMVTKEIAATDKDVEKYEKAIVYLRKSQRSGKEEATKQIPAIYLEIAHLFRDKEDAKNHINYLFKAKVSGSKQALKELKDLERKSTPSESPEEIKSKKNPIELTKQTLRTAWTPGFQFGKGVTLEGAPTACVIKNMGWREEQVAGFDQRFEDLVVDTSDVARIVNMGALLSTTHSTWHLKAIADYVKELRLNNTTVHCIIATTYLSPCQEVFSEAKLNDPCLRYLQREGFSKFRELYGTHFIAGASKGALFLGCITLKLNNREEILGLRASLSGSMLGLVESGVSCAKDVKNTIEQKILEVHVKTIGIGTPITGRADTLDTLHQQHAEFRKIIQDPKNLSPVEAICEPWYSLTEVQECIVQKPEVVSLSGVLKHWQERILKGDNAQSLNQLYTPLKSVNTIGNMSAEDKGVDLYDTFTTFMKSNKKVFVLLGEAGSGKSFFLQYLEKQFWETFDPLKEFDSWIPIRIELGTLSNPVTDSVVEHLKRQGYTDSQIQELKQKGKVLIILDGYDEGRYQEKALYQNLFVTNQLNEWNGKVIISGRLGASDALNPEKGDHLTRFSPIEGEKIRKDLVEEALVCPFFHSQITQYVKKFTQHAAADLKKQYPDWFDNEGKKYQEAVARIPGLNALVTTPFILHSVIEVLPRILEQRQGDLTSKIAKVEIYECFTTSCFEREEAKLLKRGLPRPADLEKANLVTLTREFCHLIASQLHETNINSIVFIEEDQKIKNDWDFYLGDREEALFLRDICSDVFRKSSVFEAGQYRAQYAFQHQELRDYFLSISLT